MLPQGSIKVEKLKSILRQKGKGEQPYIQYLLCA